MSLIKKLRNLNKKVYVYLRRCNIKRVVKQEKKANTCKNVLTKEQKNAVKRFYSPYIKTSPLYHNFYTEKREEFCVEYLPDDVYYNYIDMFYNDHQSALIYDNKCLYERILPKAKHPVTVVCRINGIWLDSEQNLIDIEKAIEKILVQEACFIKRAVDCGGGFGVFYFESKKQGKDDLMKIIHKIKEDIIVQQPIKQHESLARINQSSVNTIRVVSFLDKVDGVKIYANILRMGVDNSKFDNINSGGIICDIDENGKLRKKAYNKKGQVYFKHPNSHIEFEGYLIPNFKDVQDVVKKLHLSISQFRLVSWDFTIDENGQPVFVEVNMSSGGINIVQLPHGPLFGSDTEKILKEVFNKN